MVTVLLGVNPEPLTANAPLVNATLMAGFCAVGGAEGGGGVCAGEAEAEAALVSSHRCKSARCRYYVAPPCTHQRHLQAVPRHPLHRSMAAILFQAGR